MTSPLTTYITLICTSGVLNLYLCFNVFFKRRLYTNIANFFVLYTAFITIYCFASAFGLLATTLEQMKFWTTIQYIGMPISTPLGLLFIMNYLGIKLTKKINFAILTIPVISFLMVATNDFHHLHYRVFEVDPVLGAPFIYQDIGIWYVIHGIFTFSCMFVAFLLALSRWRETAKTYRPQLLSLMFGQLVPMVTAFLYLIGWTPQGIDPVPMVLCISSLFYLWSINSSRMFTIMPIAKDAIFNSINDGVIVLDDSNRLIEFNQACKEMFPPLDKNMFGVDFDTVWLLLSGDSKLETSVANQEIQLEGPDHVKRVYQVRISSLKNRKGLLIIFTDITELKRLQVQLEHQAYYDELTQILNRRAFFQKCEQAFAEAKKRSSPFTVILYDIDHFKMVNDTYGHLVGDQLLKHVVMVCQQPVKEDILFARYGGEEFVLALKGTELEGEALANRLLETLRSRPLMTTDNLIPVTFSAGVAQATNETTETLYQLLNRADKALYSAKREGRNQVHVYTN